MQHFPQCADGEEYTTPGFQSSFPIEMECQIDNQQPVQELTHEDIISSLFPEQCWNIPSLQGIEQTAWTPEQHTSFSEQYPYSTALSIMPPPSITTEPDQWSQLFGEDAPQLWADQLYPSPEYSLHSIIDQSIDAYPYMEELHPGLERQRNGENNTRFARTSTLSAKHSQDHGGEENAETEEEEEREEEEDLTSDIYAQRFQRDRDLVHDRIGALAVSVAAQSFIRDKKRAAVIKKIIAFLTSLRCMSKQMGCEDASNPWASLVDIQSPLLTAPPSDLYHAMSTVWKKNVVPRNRNQLEQKLSFAQASGVADRWFNVGGYSFSLSGLLTEQEMNIILVAWIISVYWSELQYYLVLLHFSRMDILLRKLDCNLIARIRFFSSLCRIAQDDARFKALAFDLLCSSGEEYTLSMLEYMHSVWPGPLIGLDVDGRVRKQVGRDLNRAYAWLKKLSS